MDFHDYVLFLLDFVTSMYLIHLIKSNAFDQRIIKLHEVKEDWTKGCLFL